MEIYSLALRLWAVGEEQGGAGGLLALDPKTISIQIAGFLLLYLLLSKLLFKPIGKVLDDRRNEIQASYAKVQADLAAAAQQQAELAKRLSEIEAESRERMQAAIREGQSMKDEILADANRQRERILEAGQEQLNRDRAAVVAALREEMASLAIAAASKVLDESLDSERHRRLVHDFIQRAGVS